MNLEELREFAEQEQQRQAVFQHRILYCSSAGCVPSSGDSVKEVLIKTVAEMGLTGSCEVLGTGCLGMCGEGPMVFVQSDQTLYKLVDAKVAKRIIEEHIVQGKPVDENPEEGTGIPDPIGRPIEFYKYVLTLIKKETERISKLL